MDLWSLSKITCDEISTIRYLESVSAKEITHKFCTSNQFYPMKNKSRLRCKSCKRDFRPFKDSHFALLCIPYSKWFILIKLFEISAAAKVAAEQTQLNYDTVLRAFEIFRHHILEHSNSEFPMFRGEIEVDEAYFGGKRKGNRGRGAENKITVLGTVEKRCKRTC